MQPFTSHTGIAVPLLKDDVNTDQVAPVAAMREMKPDYTKMLFVRARAEDPNHPLNLPQFAKPGILVTGNNFGVDIKLGMMMAAFKPMIEAEISKNLGRIIEKASGGQA